MFIGVTPPDQLDKYQCLNLFYKKRKLSFPLPDSTLADEIIKFVSEKSKIEKDDSLIEPIVITRKQKTFIFCLIGTYILLPFFIAFFLISPLISKQAAGIFLLIWFYVGLFLGPGTVSMLIFYRPLYFRRADLQREGKGYNLVLAFIIISIGFVWFLYSVFTEIFNLLK
jgi:hypothetical protein